MKPLFVGFGVTGAFTAAFVFINREKEPAKPKEAPPLFASANQGGSAVDRNDSRLIPRMPKEQAAVEEKQVPRSGTTVPALFSCPDSVYHVSIENQDDSGQTTPFLTIKRGENVIYRGLFQAGIKKALWSPDKRHVAIEEDPESPGDLVWIIDLATGNLVKKPYDEISKRVAEGLHESVRASAVENWGSDVVSEGSEALVDQWVDSSTLALRVRHFFLLPPNFDAFHSLDRRYLWSIDDHVSEPVSGEQEQARPAETPPERSASQLAMVHSWTQIDNHRLHSSQEFSVDRANDYVSFGLFWMERFGAMKQVASVADLDWSRARVAGDFNKDGAFAGATRIDIPMKAGLSPRVMRWNVDTGYSVESPPWSEGVSPASEETSGSEIWLIAANPRAAAELVELFKKFQPRVGAGKDNAAPEQAGGYSGERYPQTRMGLIHSADFSHLGRDDLRYAINEMFARRGALFGNSEVLATFEGFDWYRPIATMTLEDIEASFSEHEKANLKILGGLRDQKK
jgi:hypothetical protein